MGRIGIKTFQRPLRYQKITLDDGKVIRQGYEKGIDIKIALDIVKLANQEAYDVEIIFSQDQDLTEAVKEVKLISRQTNRWIKLVSAFPRGNKSRGINGTDWIKINKKDYDTCLDNRQYF